MKKNAFFVLCSVLSIIPYNVNAEEVLVPIASFEIYSNDCTNWNVYVTYTATPMDSSILDALEGMRSFAVDSHLHVDDYGRASWTTNQSLGGTNKQKLEAINAIIYGTKNPSPYQTTGRGISHSGTCAADFNQKECTGVMISTSRPGTFYNSDVTTFPSGACRYIPPANRSCTFDATSSTIDLGSWSGNGTRKGSTSIGVTCTSDTTYQISLAGGGDKITMNNMVTTIKADNKTLPAVLNGSQGKNTFILETSSVVNGVGKYVQYGTLFLDIL